MRIPRSLPFCITAALLGLCTLAGRGEVAEQSPSPAPATSAPSAAPVPIDWQPWKTTPFERAARENKFVLVYMQTPWSRDCRTMEAGALADAAVTALLASRYISINIDGDSRLDLANRFREAAWPVTVIFAPGGAEVTRRSGVLTPQALEALLKSSSEISTIPPSPDVEIVDSETDLLPADLRKALSETVLSHYSKKEGIEGESGLPFDAGNVDYCIFEAAQGNNLAESVAKQMLDVELANRDLVWGGFYERLHGQRADFAKTLVSQAVHIRLYAEGYALTGKSAYLQAARESYRYVREFLTNPDGLVYASQCGYVANIDPKTYFKAGDGERRKMGAPQVDTHVYSRENGLFISALCALYTATGEARFLNEAEAAAGWLVNFRSMPDGGFRHDLANDAGPYLADSVAMGTALTDLYTVSARSEWRWRATQCSEAIAARYKSDCGFVTADPADFRDFKPTPQFSENVALARLGNRLYSFTKAQLARQLSQGSMHFLTSPEAIKTRGILLGGVLLADSELNIEPIHILVIGSRTDPAAKKLFGAAVQLPYGGCLAEWWDRKEPALPQWRTDFPVEPDAAAYVYTTTNCSPPLKTPDALISKIAEFKHRPNSK